MTHCHGGLCMLQLNLDGNSVPTKNKCLFRCRSWPSLVEDVIPLKSGRWSWIRVRSTRHGIAGRNDRCGWAFEKPFQCVSAEFFKNQTLHPLITSWLFIRKFWE